ncbi:nucleotidyltransferase family protein [Arthrobacter sp. NtRootA1]|uniref:nucleotidyltransferase family protein n=1 Tax=Arthrobacter sp. NtRootA1 TaxID=2830983 RepID=UPI001CC778D8|nr:nucleotidyltransferase family protein [Arthrobacter sp. NtRootA1]BCW08026.1 hypothetical protein NtRootA1_41640 [Arthrobacter sp. NtRootA1]
MKWDEMELFEFLCVVAGRKIKDDRVIPVTVNASREVVLQALIRHRLVGRLQRLLNDRAMVLDDEQLIVEVQEEQHRVESRNDFYLQEISRVQRHLTRKSLESVLIKGPTASLITGESSPIRMYADIDLVVPQASRGKADLYYEPLREINHVLRPDWPCGIHEAGHFARVLTTGEAEKAGFGHYSLDLHHCFPIWGYPALEVVDLAKPGRIDIDEGAESQPADRSEITFDALFGNSTNIETSHGPIRVLKAEMSALIICGNLLKDKLKPHWLTNHTIRLSELAELADLMSREEFDVVLFRDLVTEWEAEDAAGFAAAACEEYLRILPWPLMAYQGQAVNHYVTLWSRDHFPFLLRTVPGLLDASEEIIRTQSLEHSAAKLGGKVLKLEPGRPTPDIATENPNIRSFNHRLQGRNISAFFTFAWTNESLSVELRLDSGSLWGHCVALLNFGNPAVEIYHSYPYAATRVRNRAPGGASTEEAITAEWTEEGVDANRLVLRAELPWAIFPSYKPDAMTHLDAFVGFQDISPTDPARNASVIFPLRLVAP